MVTRGFYAVAEHDSSNTILKFKMADPKWRLNLRFQQFVLYNVCKIYVTAILDSQAWISRFLYRILIQRPWESLVNPYQSGISDFWRNENYYMGLYRTGPAKQRFAIERYSGALPSGCCSKLSMGQQILQKLCSICSPRHLSKKSPKWGVTASLNRE